MVTISSLESVGLLHDSCAPHFYIVPLCFKENWEPPCHRKVCLENFQQNINSLTVSTYTDKTSKASVQLLLSGQVGDCPGGNGAEAYVLNGNGQPFAPQ